jgi:thioesterase domain-containing protein/acyl carrier protein
LAPSNAAHYSALLRTLEAESRVPQRIVHLWALDTLPGAGNGAMGEQAMAFDSLVNLVRAMQELDIAAPLHLSIVTAGAFAVDGEPVPHPERAFALGPCRVVPHEMPNVTTRLVDFAQAELASAASVIVQETRTAQGPDLVAYRQGRRFSQQLSQPEAGASTGHLPVVRERGVYLITGGFGDIGLELAAWLAEEKKARLALVSRRALPPRASWPALAASGDHSADVRLVRRLVALEAHGAQVVTLQADVADRRAMTRVIGECRARFGTINGVFHAAGVLDDAPIAAKTPESIARVIGAKATGAQVLHELLPPGDLDVFCVFSSTSVLLGGAGQVDYVAANAFLDSLAASRDDGFAIRWGIWGDRGMAARAYGRVLPNDAPQHAHPLLGAQVASDDGAAFEAAYDADKLWVLREHRVAGRAVLPGTAYIELARAAMMHLHPRAAIEIRSLSFEEAMVFQPGEVRVVRTELRRNGSNYDFTVRSRAPHDADWLEHARASASVFLGELAAAPSPAATGWQPGLIPQEKVVAFGDRWHNLVRMQIGSGRAFAQLELAPQFHLDAQTFGAHPALTDMAATFGLHLLEAGKRTVQLFVPLSIDRIRIAAPLPPRISSCVKLTSAASERLATFDVTLSNEAGKPLARFEGFSLRPVHPDAVSAHALPPHAANLTDAMLACGIRGEDAPVLFELVFSQASRDLVVSSIDIAQLAHAMSDAQPKLVARAKAAAPHASVSRNPVENMLADVWRELLGVDEIAPTDDFFALGGHSLAAVRLFARIRKQYGVDLPLATLFQAPTLGALAALVAQHANIPLAEAAEAPRKSNVIPLVTRAWSPLVAICKGSPERAPLYCVHGAGGNVLNFKFISDRLGPLQPFYGLQAQGVDGRVPPLTTIEEMAAQYVEAIRAVDPRGPYQLAGYSAGGVIAIEMAQQLAKLGAKTSLLAMIDTLAPVAARRPIPRWKKLWLMRHWNLQFLLDRSSRRRKGREGDVLYAQALERAARGEPLPPELVEHHLFRNFIDAQSRYTPAAYEGDVLLFRAAQAETQYLAAGPTLGWDEYVKGALRVVEVTGSHFTMMSEPGVSQLIDGLRVRLKLPEHVPQQRPVIKGSGVRPAMPVTLSRSDS